MTCDIHALMRDANDINSASDDFIEDQVHALREAIVAGFYFRALFSKLRDKVESQWGRVAAIL